MARHFVQGSVSRLVPLVCIALGAQTIDELGRRAVEAERRGELTPGDYVVLTEADFKHANVKASETIEVETFCAAADIPPMYYDKPYYLAAAKGGAKVYSLLRQALDG